jgi:hypothetical protein
LAVKFSGDEHKWKFGPAPKTVWRRREKVIRHREEAKLEKDIVARTASLMGLNFG